MANLAVRVLKGKADTQVVTGELLWIFDPTWFLCYRQLPVGRVVSKQFSMDGFRAVCHIE